MDFVKEISVGNRRKKTKEEIKKATELLEKARAEDSKMVTGVFINKEVEGGDLSFTYKKYKEDPHRTYHFEDGKTYTVPLGVAKHINNQTKVKRHSYLVDKNGKKILGTGNPRQRYQFNSTEFM